MKVTTFDGTIAERKECRYIGGTYYKMGTQCIKMPDDKWHRINNGLIVYNYSKNKWVFKNEFDLIEGIVDINEKGSFIIGYFEKNIIENITIVDGLITTIAINDKILLQNSSYVEELSSGYFYLVKDDNSYIPSSLKNKRIKNRYSFKLSYNFEQNYKKFLDNYISYFEYDSTKNEFYKELEQISFGVEFETYNGMIPERHCLKTGLIPLIDGSLRHGSVEPFEYSTIPLQGEKGLHSLNKNCELLDKYCISTTDCSLHMNIGSIDITKSYIISLYKILLSIEKEIYSMFPCDFIHTSVFKSTGKDYCNPLEKINFTNNLEKDINKLFNYYIYGTENPFKSEDKIIEENSFENFLENIRTKKREKTEEYFIGMNHPSDSTFNRKWTQEFRYKWCNLIPLLFNKRGVVEFRIHTPTFNSNKVINWLFITAGICKFADKYRDYYVDKNIKKLDLKHILNSVYSPKLSKYLNDYINYRKTFVKKNNEKGDTYGRSEIKLDNIDDFKSDIQSLI